ncbi:Limulus clotting factor C, partial [Pseudolycoriella hygida]
MEVRRFTIAIAFGVVLVDIFGYSSEVYGCGRRLVKHEALIVKGAHCVHENGHLLLPERVLIQLGRSNLKISGPYSQDFEAYQIFPHHNFNATNLRHDIAIVRLATKVTFSSYVHPICLWNPNKQSLSEVIGKQGTVVGFGITETNKISYTLQHAVMPVVSLTTCLDSNRDFYGSFLSDYSFCAGFRNGTTACNGDSGGGFTFQEHGVYRIRGIVSLTQVRSTEHNRLCKVDEYVVFTDVAKYLSWIQEIAPTGSIESGEYNPVASTPEIQFCYFLNNDLTNTRIARDDCNDRCAATPRCTHFTWTNYNGGTCWMKQNPVTEMDAHISYDKAAVCGIVNNNANIEWKGKDWAFGCDFHENDIINVKGSSKECHENCLATVGCTHFSWTDFDGGTCWLKGNSVGKNEAYVSSDPSSVC